MMICDPELRRLEQENEALRIAKRKEDLRRENERLRRQLGARDGTAPIDRPRRWPTREDFLT